MKKIAVALSILLMGGFFIYLPGSEAGNPITTDDVYAYYGTPPNIDGRITDDDLWIEVPETIGEYPEGGVSIRAKHDGTFLYILTVTRGYGEYIDNILFEDDGTSPDRVLDSTNEDEKYVGLSEFPDGYRDAHWTGGWAVDMNLHGGAMGTNDGYSFISEWWLPLDTDTSEDIDVSSNETLGFAAGWTWGWPSGYGNWPYDPTTWGELHIIYDAFIGDPVDIMLNSPSDGSIIAPGRTIDLYISGTDITADYRVDGGSPVNLYYPYDFVATGWSDGGHTLQVNAQDSGGNSASATYSFTVDSVKPTIALNDPENNSFIPPGTLIDFSITDEHISNVHYSVNEGDEYTLYPNYYIYTWSWPDGNYIITVDARDMANNAQIEYFNFTIDSTPPEIFIHNLENNSMIKGGFLIELSFVDACIDEVFYTLDSGAEEELFYPFEINTTAWGDGNHTVTVNANDKVGNANTTWFNVTVDSTPPDLVINSPQNNTIAKPGILINMTIGDPHLEKVYYTVNNGKKETLTDPYLINTSDWIDRNYIILVTAIDEVNNINSIMLNLTLDSKSPKILLSSPVNNSFITENMMINFMISDENLKEVTYWVNGDSSMLLTPPYSIDTGPWSDGEYIVNIRGEDEAGNLNEQWFCFTKDTTTPQIILESPDNGSVLQSESILDFEITDLNLSSVSYSLNDGAFIYMEEPYEIDPTGWDDDEYRVTIRAIDKAGHQNEKWFVFWIDFLSPFVIVSSPVDDAADVSENWDITIEFNEPMDPASVESAISIEPFTEFSCLWSNNNKTLTFNLTEPLGYETYYQISISTQAKDQTGRGMEDTYLLDFTTREKPKEGDGGGISVFIFLAAVMAIVVAVIIVFLVSGRMKKAKGEALPPQVQAPQTMQVICSNCRNLLSVYDIGTTMNVTCPFCSTLLTVQSQRTAFQVPQPIPQPLVQMQPQQPTMQIACPSCRHVFIINKMTGPMRVQCPNCGVTGTLSM